MDNRRRQVLSRLHYPSSIGEPRSHGYFMSAEAVVAAANVGPKFLNEFYELGEFADEIKPGCKITIRTDKTWAYLVAFTSDQCVTVLDQQGPREIPWSDVLERVA